MNPTVRAFVIAALSFPLSDATAQVSFGGRPIGLLPHAPELAMPPVLTLPVVDAAAMMTEDEARIAAGIKGPYRFGFNHEVDLGTSGQGAWTTLRNGDRVWQAIIECPSAYSINFRFDRYVVPEGGRVFVYNDEGRWFGAFTAASAGGLQSMGVSQMPGSRITVEYHEPRAVSGQGELHIDRVTHAYRDVFRYMKDLREFGESGDCNINVICPEGDAWRDQIRSVAIITTGGSGFCTGSLLNNCALDSTPYFLTANHCLSADVENWVFRFNWDSPSCDPTEQGPIDQTVANCVMLVSNSPTDMAFLELSSIPPDDYNVFYSGWDKSGSTPDSVCGIHHPSGDIKKISKSYSPILQQNIDVGNGPADCWQVTVWDAGTTEPGSSGSGLWNQNKMIIGQLYGGAAACGNSVNDYYGRFDLSWPLLEQYLGTCGDSLPGLGDGEPIEEPIHFDAAITSIVNIPELICGDSVIAPIITLKNNGDIVLTAVTISYGLVGSPVNLFEWTGSLQPGQTANVPLPAIVVPSGTLELSVSSSTPNGNVDQVPENDPWSLSFTVNNPGGNVLLLLTLDNFGSDVTWELMNDQGTLLYSGGPYPDFEEGMVDSVPFCLTDGCYTFTIYDAFGDGICCANGDGSILIQNSDGSVLVENDGQYEEVFTTDPPFCMEVVGVSERPADLSFGLYPNPTGGMFTIELPEGIGAVRSSLVDNTGRLVRSFASSNGAGPLTFDVSDLPEGLYTVLVESGAGRGAKRLSVQH